MTPREAIAWLFALAGAPFLIAGWALSAVGHQLCGVADRLSPDPWMGE